jgi:signal transduction histidine kinase
MAIAKLEYGLVGVFRLFVGFRLVLVLVSGLELTNPDELLRSHLIYFIMSISEVLFLGIWLWWDWPRCHAGPWFLPIALAVCTVMPIAELSVAFSDELDAHQLGGMMGSMINILLVLPLLLIAWQYRFATAVVFCLGTLVLRVLLFPRVLLTGVDFSRLELQDLGMEIQNLVWSTLAFALVGYLVDRIMKVQREQRGKLAEANAQLVNHAVTREQLATSRERNRVARELHDTLAHSLAALAIQLDSMAARWPDMPDKAGQTLDLALATARSGLDETRRALGALRAGTLDDLGLVLALECLAKEIAGRHRVEVVCQVSGDPAFAGTDVAHCFYRVAQEALENSVRHAEAGRLRLEFRAGQGVLDLSVSDDGAGFDPAVEVSGHGYGVRGMRERAELIGAALVIQSRPGQGTAVTMAWREAT